MPTFRYTHTMDNLNMMTLRLLLSNLLQFPHAQFAVQVDNMDGSKVHMDEATYRYVHNILST